MAPSWPGQACTGGRAGLSGQHGVGSGIRGWASFRQASRPLHGRGFRSSASANALKTGIVGLPNVGKSTLFNALCANGKAQAENFPFCTIEPNVGVVAVPDPRLEVLVKLSNSERPVPTTIEFVDIAGLVKGASKGEGLGNKFLANIRECDSLVQVVRCFEDDDVIHVEGRVDPVTDADTINFELALADLAQVERRLERLAKTRPKSVEEGRQQEAERDALAQVQAALEQGQPARTAGLAPEQAAALRGLCLLTLKPLTYAANVTEADLAGAGAGNPHVQALERVAAAEGSRVVVVSAQVEAELRDLDAEEAAEYLAGLGAAEGGLAALVRATYAQLGLLTFFTTGKQESRAWTVHAGSTAPQAAGVIHSDFEKGFIRAETVGFEDCVQAGGLQAARERGLVRLEGKDYVVREGDVMLFRFNV